MVPLLGALPSHGYGVAGRRGTAPRGFPGTGPRVGWRGRLRPAGEGRDPGSGDPGSPAAGSRGPAAACSSARRVAPARRALHSRSLHQRLREEGRDPSLAHFPPSQTRTLPRSRSLTPSLSRSLAHTHARTRRRGSPSRARSPSGSSGRPPGSGLARPPAPGLPPHAAPRGGRTGGSPGPLPEVRARGAAGGAATSPPRGGCPAWREPPGPLEPPGGRRGGRASRRRGSQGSRARPPRAPSSWRGRRGGSFPRPNFPRRGAEPPLGPEPAAPTRPHPPWSLETRSLRNARGPRGDSARGSPPRAESGRGGGAQPRHGGQDPGVPGAPHPPASGLSSRAPPRGGVRGQEIPHGVSVCARVCVCEVVQCPGAPRGRLEPRRHARLQPPRGEEGGWPTGTLAAPPAHTRCPGAVGPTRRQAAREGQRCPLPSDPALGTLFPPRKKDRDRRPHVQRERHWRLTLEGWDAGRGGMDCVGALDAGNGLGPDPSHSRLRT